MKDAERHELVARALKGALSAGERKDFERRMQADPALAALWEQEQSLERVLDWLPNAPVPSNFTSLVLQAVRGTAREPAAPPKLRFQWLVARLAGGLAALAILCFAVLQQRQNAHRSEVAATVNAFHDTALAIGDGAASTDILANFETIQQLSLPSDSELDIELLDALQK